MRVWCEWCHVSRVGSVRYTGIHGASSFLSTGSAHCARRRTALHVSRGIRDAGTPKLFVVEP